MLLEKSIPCLLPYFFVALLILDELNISATIKASFQLHSLILKLFSKKTLAIYKPLLTIPGIYLEVTPNTS